MADAFMGEIIMVAYNFVPKGYALCDGSLVSIAQNSALFSLLGTTYGGDGVTTFALPDFRGRSPVGTGHGAGLSGSVLPGERAGFESITLSTANLPMHTHAASTSGLRAIPRASTAVGTESVAGGVLANTDPSSCASAVAADTDMAPLQITGNVTIGPAGGSMPLGIRNPYLATQFVIAMYGTYPSHD
jgi:microcystin-dependent protein